MKKSIFIFAAFFAATFANAQITLEHTINEFVWTSTDVYGDLYKGGSQEAPYLYSFTPQQINFYDKNTYELYKSCIFTTSGNDYVCCVTRNIFTTDGKTSFILCCSSGQSYSYRIIDEDGEEVFNFNNPQLDKYKFYIIKINGCYKLLAREVNKTYIYSLPGNGEVSTDIVSPSSLKPSARKIARDGQVLVETENNTYTLQGQEVK